MARCRNELADEETAARFGDLASALPLAPTDAFPTVLATARLVAFMEIASARVLQPHLAQGQLSVGVVVDITRSAPTPTGAAVTATARYLGRDGKLFEFEVVAVDSGGEIGRARHRRTVVDTGRVLANADRRIAAAGG